MGRRKTHLFDGLWRRGDPSDKECSGSFRIATSPWGLLAMTAPFQPIGIMI
jgi:hypothetical protein